MAVRHAGLLVVRGVAAVAKVTLPHSQVAGVHQRNQITFCLGKCDLIYTNKWRRFKKWVDQERTAGHPVGSGEICLTKHNTELYFTEEVVFCLIKPSM